MALRNVVVTSIPCPHCGALHRYGFELDVGRGTISSLDIGDTLPWKGPKPPPGLWTTEGVGHCWNCDNYIDALCTFDGLTLVNVAAIDPSLEDHASPHHPSGDSPVTPTPAHSDLFLDAVHLLDSFYYWRKARQNSTTLRAWQVTSDARTDWLVNPEAFLAFHRGLSPAERRAVKPFLRCINARVLRTNEAAALRAPPTFQQLRQAMSRVDSPGTYTMDIVHASYAAAQGMPFVGDNTFARWSQTTFGSSRYARGILYSVQDIEDIAKALGYQ